MKNGEKWEKHKKKEDTAVEWDDKFEKWKHLSGFCKTYAEIQEDCKFYLKHVKVTNKCFMFNCLIKKTVYHLFNIQANFQITYVHFKNSFSDFITLLRKGVISYE